MSQSEDRPRTILDIDAEVFERRVESIRRELIALDNLYLSPRIKGALKDLRADLNTIAAERKAEI